MKLFDENKHINELPKYQCCWSEIINGFLVQCQSFDTKLDKDNATERYFCPKDMPKVINIRKQMHWNCINRDKLIEWLESKQLDFDSCKGVGFVFEEEWRQLINLIKQGEFD